MVAQWIRIPSGSPNPVPVLSAKGEERVGHSAAAAEQREARGCSTTACQRWERHLRDRTEPRRKIEAEHDKNHLLATK